MALATAHTVSLHGRAGHLIDVQVDISPGAGRHRRSWGGRTRRCNEARDRCRMAVANSGCDVAGDPAGDDPAVAGRPAQARHALRPGHRGGGAGARAARSRAPLSDAVFIGELTLDGGLRSVPGVLPMAMAAPPAGSSG